MPRRKRPSKPKNPRAEDLPKNPEFQQFAKDLGEILKVPKAEVDKRVEEAKKRRQS